MTDSSPQVPPPAKVTAAGTPDLASLFTLAVAVVIIAALYLAREVLIPITLAILLSFVLAPVVSGLRRIRVPHVPAVLISVTVGFGLILAISGLIGLQIAGLADDIPQYASTIERKVETVRSATLGRVTAFVARLDRQAASAPVDKPATAGGSGPAPAPGAPPAPGLEAARPNALGSAVQPVPVSIQPSASQPFELARAILTPVLEPISNVLIVLIIAVFVLMQREDLRDRLIRLFGSSDLHRTTMAMDDAALRLGRYFLAQLAINASFGLIIAIGLAIIGVPSPILWGVIGALLRFVPYIGPVIAGLLPAAVAAAAFPGWSTVAWTVGLFAAVEALTGQVLEPLIYGRSTGLSPAAVVISAIFWTWIWGPIGLVLSTPLTLCLVVLGRHVDRLEFLEVLLGDRPALTPVENFYQRMLASDPDEALRQAELLLKERSLLAYYDEVAICGLRLAANDALRGVLSDERLSEIRGSVGTLVEDLADHAEPEAPDAKAARPAGEVTAGAGAQGGAGPQGPAEAATPLHAVLAARWSGPTPVLCIAGRGPLDEAASAMLVQLLGQNGLKAQGLDHAAVSRGAIGQLDPAGIAMIVITYVEITGSPAHLHYLLRRLRRQYPGVTVAVGLWPADDEVIRDKRLRAVIGADHYTTSLRDAVDACLSEAYRPETGAPVEAAAA